MPEYDQIPLDKYQTRVIAFVDLLGFSKLIEGTSAGKPSESFVYSAIQSIYDILFDFEANNPGNSSLRISHFSDSVVISVYFKELPDLVLMIRHIRYIQQKLLEEYGILLRGGITCGDLIHTDSILMGPAMVEAYHMECDNDKAKYPRIIISNDVLRLWNKGIEVLEVKDCPDNQFMTKDDDGFIYIDYFNDLDDNFENDGEYFYTMAMRLIDKNINSTCNNVTKKYKWMLEKLKASNLERRFGGGG